MKILTSLRKLSDLDVKFVSLVDRGANRIPFRIIKSQEKNMSIDLSSLGFRVKKSASEAKKDQPASVSAIILSSGDEDTIFKAQTLLSTHGIELTESTTFEDGTIAIHKEDTAFADGGTIVRLNDTTAVVLDNMGEHLANLKKSAFGELAEDNGYFDGPSLIMATANAVIKDGVQKAESPTAAATMVRDSMESVQQYLGYLTMAMPSAVMKAEAELESIVKSGFVPGKKGVNPFAKKPDAETPAENADPADDEVQEGEAEADPKKKKVVVEAACDPKDDKIKKAEDLLKSSMSDAEKEFMVGISDNGAQMDFMRMAPEQRSAEMGKGTSDVKKEEVTAPQDNAQIEKVLKAMSDMAFAVATLTKNVGVLSADISLIKKSTEEKIDVLAKKAETATYAVRGTVLASEVPGDPQPLAKIKKVDNDPRTGVFDSAMIPRNR